MRRLWFLLGIALGALMMWSWLSEDRKLATRTRRYNEKMASHRTAGRIDLAVEGMEQGIDYSDDDWWEEELSQYKDDKGDEPDGYATTA